MADRDPGSLSENQLNIPNYSTGSQSAAVGKIALLILPVKTAPLCYVRPKNNNFVQNIFLIGLNLNLSYFLSTSFVMDSNRIGPNLCVILSTILEHRQFIRDRSDQG